MSGFTTRNAPPDAAPAMMRDAAPCDCANAFTAGFGPTYAMSSAPENSASTAAGPALKIAVCRSTFLPSFLAKIPPSSPTSAGACVTLSK